ncbi:hypothetical protein GCM10010991_28540 [Gemmobacter aquaticus]|uniref:Uncharacterized protein n=1 Tax=Gemmobacter aquaticus TaxID=490185 RepID=A0A917YLQ0_9RHOB|nr:hypothetical protein [Gemmobacter aquaticus]GGO35755.1 hypothetical protein GCM10010991_28540 [Gemmobacter aquaticus]
MNIHTPGGGRVATMAPSPDDLFVVTTVAGRKVSLHTEEQFGHALKLAEAAAIRMAPVPVTIKVMSLTWAEAQRFGLIPSDLFKNEAPEQQAEWRRQIVATLWGVVYNCNQAKPRADALELLKELGES